MSNVIKNAGYNTEEVYFHRENQRLIEEAKAQKQAQQTADLPNNVIPINRNKKLVATNQTKKDAA